MHKDNQKTILLSENFIGVRLDKALSEQIPEYSRSDIKKFIQQKRIQSTSGQSLASPSMKISAPMELLITFPQEQKQILKAENIPLDVIYDDESIAVINKQPGLSMHPGAGVQTGTLVNALMERFGPDNLAWAAGEDRPGIIHRLDKETSGLVVIAKTNDSCSFLKNAIKKRTVKRHYMALVWGAPSPREGCIETWYGRHPKNRLKMAVQEQDGKKAITYYDIIAPLGLHASLVKCMLDTGRTHQIRVHMAHIGHPVIGDTVYGPHYPTQLKRLDSSIRQQLESLKRQMLHAYELTLPHPVTHEEMTFKADPPSDMQDTLDLFKII